MDPKKIATDIIRWSPFQKAKDNNPQGNNRKVYFFTAAIVCGVLAFLFSDSGKFMIALIVVAVALAILGVREMDG